MDEHNEYIPSKVLRVLADGMESKRSMGGVKEGEGVAE